MELFFGRHSELLIGALTFLIQVGVFKFLYSFIRDYRETGEARDNAVRSLLRTEIINIYHKAENDGYLPIYNLENINDMYNTYKKLGGNGAITELYNKAIKFPNTPENRKDGDEQQ